MFKRSCIALCMALAATTAYGQALLACTTAQSACTGYAPVNGLQMYYEIHGSGRPLVLLHGGGSTIYTSFGRILPALARSQQVIAVELQAHGHTSDRNAPETFAQDADDVTELLRQLGVPQADIFGFSNGGQTAMEMAIRHPEKVHKLVLASMFYKRDGAPAAFWAGIAKAKFSDMPQVYKDAYAKINPDPAALINMFHKDAQRMQSFKDWKASDVSVIQAPTFIVIGDQDLTRPEHAVEMYRLLPHARLAILPGIHGGYMGEAMSPDTGSQVPALFVAMLDEFLAAPGGGQPAG